MGRKKILIFIFCIISTLIYAQKPTSFLPKLKTGDEYTRNMITKIKFSQESIDSKTSDSTTMKKEFSIDQDIYLKIASFNETNNEYELIFEVTRVIISIKEKEKENLFYYGVKEGRKNANQNWVALSGFKESNFRYLVNANGKKIKLIDSDSFLSGIRNGCPPEVLSVIAGIYNENTLEKIFNQFMNQNFPEKPVLPGYKWNYSQDLQLSGDSLITLDSKAEFTGMKKLNKKNCAFIVTESSMSTNNKADYSNIKVIKGNSSSRMYFSQDIGMTLQGDANQELEYNIILPDSSGSAEKTIKIKSTQTIISKMIKYPGKK